MLFDSIAFPPPFYCGIHLARVLRIGYKRDGAKMRPFGS